MEVTNVGPLDASLVVQGGCLPFDTPRMAQSGRSAVRRKNLQGLAKYSGKLKTAAHDDETTACCSRSAYLHVAHCVVVCIVHGAAKRQSITALAKKQAARLQPNARPGAEACL
jgi:hypothetical protein